VDRHVEPAQKVTDEMSAFPAGHSVVVGVDGSPQGDGALSMATEEARLRDEQLIVIFAFRPIPTAFVAMSHEDLPELQEEAEATLKGILGRGPSREGIDVVAKTVPGDPAEVLIEASSNAAVLVVGSRGRGGFEGLRVGSVSNKCLHHAHCPVLVVR
jgi:nucleotide-binding universal stress UspA family protein